ncbi:MAG: GNAT family N-acetyltransferase [Candidatus Latescibacterota bacterium]|nr:GNAT family N-acetyltransferase [Candidatus Latescibacterota bacterium]
MSANPAPHIRPYLPDDLDRLKELTAVCFDGVSIDRNIQEKFGKIGGQDWRFRKLRHIDADVAGDHSRGVFVYELAGRVVGYITTRVDGDTRIGWIPNMAVDPAHQGQGIGKALMAQALRHMRDCGMEAAKIETLEQNLIGSKFYPGTGFEEVGRQVHYLMRLHEDDG